MQSLHDFLSPERRDITVPECRLEFSSFQGCLQVRAACCCRNHLSYSNHPVPPWHWASRMMRRAYDNISLVSLSSVRIAIYGRKQNTHDRGDSISRRRWGRPATAFWDGRSSSWLRSAILSESSSIITTYCPDFIFWTCLALAQDRITVPSPGGLTSGSRAEVAGYVNAERPWK